MMSEYTLRAMSLDQLAERAERMKILALNYHGRLLATTKPIYPGDYIRVAPELTFNVRFSDDVPESRRFIDFKTNTMQVVFHPGIGPWDEVRGRLFFYANTEADTEHFRKALDLWFKEFEEC